MFQGCFCLAKALGKTLLLRWIWFVIVKFLILPPLFSQEGLQLC